MKREEKLIKNTIILAIGTFLPRVASFIVLPILTGYMTQEEFGTYDLITVLVGLLLPAVTLQIQTAAFRFLIDIRGDIKEEKRIVTNIFVFTLPVSIAALIILYFSLFQLDPLVRWLICIYFIFDILVSTARQIVRGLSRNMDFSVSAIIGSCGRLVFALIFVLWLRTGLVGATLTLIASVAAEFLYLMIKTRLHKYIDLSLTSKDSIKQMLKYSWPMVPNSMSMWVMRVSDRLVVTFFMGVAANAVYSVANKIPQLLTVAQTTFNMAWQENASIASKDDDAPAYYSQMFRAVFDFMAGVFGLLVAATPILFALLIRGDYGEAYYQMPILFLAMFFFSIAGYLGGVYVAYKKTTSVGITTALAAVCNLVFDIATIQWIGLYAASGSTLISYLFLCVYRMIDLKKFVDIKYDMKRIIVVLLILTAMSGLCFARNTICDVLNIAVGIAMFCVLDGKMMMSLLRRVLKKAKKL